MLHSPTLGHLAVVGQSHMLSKFLSFFSFFFIKKRGQGLPNSVSQTYGLCLILSLGYLYVSIYYYIYITIYIYIYVCVNIYYIYLYVYIYIYIFTYMYIYLYIYIYVYIYIYIYICMINYKYRYGFLAFCDWVQTLSCRELLQCPSRVTHSPSCHQGVVAYLGSSV